MFGVESTRWPPGLQDAVDLGHHVHRVVVEMLEQLAAKHRREKTVRVGVAILFGVEVIDRHSNRSPSRDITTRWSNLPTGPR